MTALKNAAAKISLRDERGEMHLQGRLVMAFVGAERMAKA